MPLSSFSGSQSRAISSKWWFTTPPPCSYSASLTLPREFLLNSILFSLLFLKLWLVVGSRLALVWFWSPTRLILTWSLPNAFFTEAGMEYSSLSGIHHALYIDVFDTVLDRWPVIRGIRSGLHPYARDRFPVLLHHPCVLYSIQVLYLFSGHKLMCCDFRLNYRYVNNGGSVPFWNFNFFWVLTLYAIFLFWTTLVRFSLSLQDYLLFNYSSSPFLDFEDGLDHLLEGWSRACRCSRRRLWRRRKEEQKEELSTSQVISIHDI